jgi:hydroxymethylbilane synthase
VIGTRGSELALWQANYIRHALLARCNGLEVALDVIRTTGDKALERPLHAMLDKGLFTRQIEQALLDGRVDLAVHSLKDLPTQLPAGLDIPAVTAREDPADVLVAKEGRSLGDLPPGAAVLTGSLRRRAQLLHLRPDLEVLPVRGNVPTRLRKLAESNAAATIMARAGLVRLGLDGHITERLAPAEFLPACGQGALALEARSDDAAVGNLLAPLNDPDTRQAVSAERAFLAELEGGCHVPLGAYARIADNGAHLGITGMVASLDGVRMVRAEVSAPLDAPDAAQELGWRLASDLRAAGCQEILDSMDTSQPNATEAGR